MLCEGQQRLCTFKQKLLYLAIQLQVGQLCRGKKGARVWTSLSWSFFKMCYTICGTFCATPWMSFRREWQKLCAISAFNHVSSHSSFKWGHFHFWFLTWSYIEVRGWRTNWTELNLKPTVSTVSWCSYGVHLHSLIPAGVKRSEKLQDHFLAEKMRPASHWIKVMPSSFISLYGSGCCNTVISFTLNRELLLLADIVYRKLHK